MGLDSALVITEQWTRTCCWPPATEERDGGRPRYADPLSLIHYKKVSSPRGDGEARGDVGMNNERLYSVLLAPIVSEKSTMLAEKNNQVAFHVLPRRPSRK